MDVVRKNFKEMLPLISDSIEKADFMAIDAEFTGLIKGREGSVFSLAEDYYTNLISGCGDFMLIQFGLCAFYWDEKRNHYMNDAYNFYLYPRGRQDRMFLCQSSSLDFLVSNGFDFNKLIKEGITYMTESLETKLRDQLTERHAHQPKEKEPVKVPDEHKQQIEDICKRVKAFIDDSSKDEMEIDRVNAYLRLLLFQELRARYKNDVLLDTKVLENKTRVIRVTRKKETDMEEQAARRKKEWEDLEEAVGFSKVARMISQSGKLVVGHNMLLDVIHTLNHFFQPLTSDYAAFKEFAHCMFPKLIDTKYISSLPPFKDKLNSSVLSELIATFAEPPFSLPKVGSHTDRGYSVNDEKGHEAGYDAYITGLCFLGMHEHLQRMRGDQGSRVQAGAAALKPFLNKLFLARTARFDSSYLNLTGPDPTPPRDHVFHLTFPREWLRADICQLFSPFGSIAVQFLDDTSAYVALDRRENAGDAYRVLSRHSVAKMTPFYQFKKPSHRMETPRADPYRFTNTTESKSRQVTNVSSPRAAPQLPVKVSRTRSNSASIAPTTLVSPPARKRTSSGVFQVDESEPVPKKTDLTRSLSDSPRKKSEVHLSGSQKTTDRELTVKKRSVTNVENSESDVEKSEAVVDNSESDVEKSETIVDNSESDLGSETSEDEKRPKLIEKFDSEAKSLCIAAFKESESWD